jgi:hypothetical protein
MTEVALSNHRASSVESQSFEREPSVLNLYALAQAEADVAARKGGRGGSSEASPTARPERAATRPPEESEKTRAPEPERSGGLGGPPGEGTCKSGHAHAHDQPDEPPPPSGMESRDAVSTFSNPERTDHNQRTSRWD